MQPFRLIPPRSILLIVFLLAPWASEPARFIFAAPVSVDQWFFTAVTMGIGSGLAACLLAWTSGWHWRWKAIVPLVACGLTLAFCTSVVLTYHPCEVPFYTTMDGKSPVGRLVCR